MIKGVLITENSVLFSDICNIVICSSLLALLLKTRKNIDANLIENFNNDTKY